MSNQIPANVMGKPGEPEVRIIKMQNRSGLLSHGKNTSNRETSGKKGGGGCE